MLNLQFLQPENIIFQIKSKYVKYNVKASPSSFQSLNLFNTQYKNDIFEFMPKTFKISTNSSSAYFNIDMLKDSSKVIRNFCKSLNDETELEYKLDIKDDENVLGMFAQLYQGKDVTFEEEQLPVSFKITRLLNITKCPNFLKPEKLRVESQSYKFSSSDAGTKDCLVSINLEKFNIFLKAQKNNVFTIITNKKEYSCNMYGVYSSKVIRKIIEKDPTANKYVYDYDDEFNEFQAMCDIFNFQQVDITKNNMNSLKDIINDLQIDYFTDFINKVIEDYQNFSQTVEDQQKIINSIEEVFNWLYNIKDISIELVHKSIVQSIWITTIENVQELAAIFLQVIQADFTIQKYIIELLIDLNKEACESNSLSILIPTIIDKLMFYFGEKKSICSFIYILHKKGFIEKEKIIEKIKDLLKKDLKTIKKIKSYKNMNLQTQKENNISHAKQLNDIKKMNNSIDNNIYAWFLPEILKMPKYKDKIYDKHLSHVDPLLNGFINHFLPDKIHLYEQMRDEGEPADPITKALRNDDIDSLKSILSKERIDTIFAKTVPFNIFEDFIPNGTTNYLNYSAAYGSIKCFKYLFLNHIKLNKFSFSCAIYGGNIEIIKIVDQNKDSIKSESANMQNAFTLFKKNYSSNIDEKENQIIPVIMKHRNNLFDWIIEQNPNLLQSSDILINISTANGNAHSLFEIIDKGYDIESNYEEILGDISEYGYYRLAELFVMVIKAKLHKKQKLKETPDPNKIHEYAVYFGNLSIFKLYVENYNITEFKYYYTYAMKHNYTSIMNYFFEVIFRSKYVLNAFAVHDIITLSIENGDDEYFEYLIDQIKTINPNIFDIFTPPASMIEDSAALGKVKTTKILADMAYSHNPILDFTISFINAAYIGCNEICEYFLNKKYNIIFDQLSYYDMLSKVSKDIFSIVVKNFSRDAKERFFGYFLPLAIKNQNKDLVEYLLKENVQNDFALIEAVKTRNLDIINLILEYNNSPSFINKKTNKGPALSIAINPIDQDEEEEDDDDDDDKNTLKIVQRLLSVPGIDPSVYDENNCTPLMLSVKSYNLEVTNAILDFYGEDLQSQAWQLNKVIKIILKMLSNHSEFAKNKKTIFAKYHRNQQKEDITPILQRILEIKNVDLNCRGGEYTILLYACETNNVNIVKMLLNSDKIDVNSYESTNGNTPLIVSVDKNNFEIVKLLIEYPQTNINVNNFFNETALTIAANKKLINIIDLLVNNEKFDPKESRLDYAFYCTSDQIILKHLLSIKLLDVNYKTMKRYFNGKSEIIKRDRINTKTKLIESVLKNDIETLDLIIHHPSFDKDKSQLNDAIFITVYNDDFQLFKKLISVLPDVNIFTRVGSSLLTCAVKARNNEMVTEILCNPTYDSKKSNIILSFIHSYPYYSCMVQLYYYDKEHDNLIDLTKLRPDGLSFLMYSHVAHLLDNDKADYNRFIFDDDKEPTKNKKNTNEDDLLFDDDNNNNNGWGNKKNNNNWGSSLFGSLRNNENDAWDDDSSDENDSLTAMKNYIAINEILRNPQKMHMLKMKAKRRHQQNRKHYKVNKDDSNIDEVVNFLIQNGADPNMPDVTQTYPLEFAIYNGNDDLALALINTGKIDFTIKIPFKQNWHEIKYKMYHEFTTYLHLAAYKSNTKIISELIDRKLMDINATDDLGETALIVACMNQSDVVVELLFNNENFDYLHKNKEGKDALMIFSPNKTFQITDKNEYLRILKQSMYHNINYI